MEKVSNPFQACNDIFFKPNRVFATLAETHNWSWLAFFIVVAIGILPGYMYFNFVDFDWYRELVIAANFADVSPAEQDMMRQSMTPQQTITFNVIGVILGTIVINAILAIYLNVAAKMDEENVNGFTDWYGFTWWVSLPVIVGSLLSIIIILLASDHQLPPSDLSPTAMGYWFSVDMSSKWFTFSQAIRLESFWTMYLIAVGISQWTRLPAQKAYIIAAAPYFIIWAIWAIIILV